MAGAWLFDAAMNPIRKYASGRSIALLALGKIFVTPRRSGGRPSKQSLPVISPVVRAGKSKLKAMSSPISAVAKPSPAHSARFLLALRLALTTEREQKMKGSNALVAGGTPETVAAVLRSANGFLGADVSAGGRAILGDFNAAMGVVRVKLIL